VLGILFALGIPAVLVLVMLNAEPRTAKLYRKTLPLAAALGVMTETIWCLASRGDGKFAGLALIVHLPFLLLFQGSDPLGGPLSLLMSAVAWSGIWWCVLLAIGLARGLFDDEAA